MSYSRDVDSLEGMEKENSKVSCSLVDIVYNKAFCNLKDILLFFWEGLSLREIAELLSIPESTVKTRLYRGRQRLKSLLAPTHSSESACLEETP